MQSLQQVTAILHESAPDVVASSAFVDVAAGVGHLLASTQVIAPSDADHRTLQRSVCSCCTALLPKKHAWVEHDDIYLLLRYCRLKEEQA